MKPIDDYQIGDTVRMMVTGMHPKMVGECISTKRKPTAGTPVYDHPRFKVVKVNDEQLSDYVGEILKPGDYIIMSDEPKN